MLAMRALLIVFTLISFASGIAAQATAPCSQVLVASPSKVDAGFALVFTATVENTLREVKYKWSTSAGTISSGRDTSTITVDTTGLGGQTIEATVEVTAKNLKCSAKSKTSITPLIIETMSFDAYGDIKWEDEKARLDNFAIQIMNEPSSRGALIAFAGNPTYKGEAAFRLQRAKNYLVSVRKVPAERLVTTDSGYRTDFTVYLWVVSEGITSLPVDLTTLPLSEIRFTKPKPNVNGKSTSRRRSN